MILLFMKRIKIPLALSFLLFSSLILGQSTPTSIKSMEQLNWEKVAPGIWKASLGEKELAPLSFTDSPKVDALKELGDPIFPLEKALTRGDHTKSRTSVRIPLEDTEQIYGLGLEFKGINRRGNVYHQKVDHYGGVTGFTHAPVPFYVSSKAYGILINTARRPSVYVGVGNRKDGRNPEPIDRTTDSKNWKARPISDAVEVSVQGKGLEIYLFAGKTTLEVVQRYNLYCGGGVLPPKWGLGFWHRMHTQSSAEDVLREIEDFKKNDFPLDVLGLEPGWQSFAYPCSFDWDSTRFPDPPKFMSSIKEQGIKINLWENPYVAPSSSMYSDIQPYTGSHMVWLGEVPDLTLPGAQKVILDHHQKSHLDIGVSGYKFDEVDGYDFWLWPDHASFPSGNDAVQIRQLYGLMIQKMFMDRFRQLGQRTYGLVRSSNAGASPLGFVLYSDYYYHRGYVTALCNSSLAGILWTPEIRSANNAEEWLRRFQSVCFSPLMQLNAWSSGLKPWSFPEVTDQVREVIQLREKLLPYLYTAFYTYNQKGIPPFRAMVLESGYHASETLIKGELHDAKNPYAESSRLEVTDQYMMGPSLLVAPVFMGEKERTVVLPEGNWYDFYTGEKVGNGETIRIKTPLEQIPLFVKDGGIIPMLKDGDELEIRHYGEKTAYYSLYDDDGESFEYEDGVFSVTGIEVLRKRGKLEGKVHQHEGTWEPPKYETSWIFMSEKK